MTYFWCFTSAAIIVFPGDHGPGKNELLLGGRNKNSRSPFPPEHHFALKEFPSRYYLVYNFLDTWEEQWDMRAKKSFLLKNLLK